MNLGKCNFYKCTKEAMYETFDNPGDPFDFDANYCEDHKGGQDEN